MQRDEQLVKQIKETFLEGLRVELTQMMNDPNPVEPGSTGTVAFVDDLGTIMVNWDDGRRLGLVFPTDKFKIIK